MIRRRRVFVKFRVKLCSGCRAAAPMNGQRYCNACHAAHMREWRKTHQLTGLARLKAICRAYTKEYQHRGIWPKGPCVSCNAAKAENHHPDYRRPDLYTRLCRGCHLALHLGQSIRMAA